MTTKIQKWGNSLAIRLPKNIADKFNLSEGSAVDIVSAQKDMRIVPKKIHSPTIDELVRGISTKNRHSETDWGTKAGNEIW